MAEDQINDAWAWLTGAPLRALIIALFGLLTVIVLRWMLTRVMNRLQRAPLPTVDTTGRVTLTLGDVPADHARIRRLRTLHQLLASTIGVVVGVVTLIMILGTFGVNIAPLIASAGVVGIAVAFGAQSLVSDVVTGLFMLVENQYNVGDRVELGALGNILAAGTIEEVGLRVTTLRDDDGRLWYVRNGQILRVANESQGWSLAVVEVALAPDTDLSTVREDVQAFVGQQLTDPALAAVALTDRDPVVRVSDISGGAAVLQVRVHAQPGQNQQLASILRRRLYAEFTRTGIKLA
ncbi:mechanosensitive ion channel [Miniimonas arenae]|uniref:Mechanosensitive ion channel n=1 Tax=Miniimonas arenae TaxID=676201 RepID=A0A5C5BBB7_9MICO|nr:MULTISPECIES: mechanosensitive ion channel domain-containing protein [Miniimonas]TNU74089.1 mechanosensitive ion channel [Miniimonas arenae]